VANERSIMAYQHPRGEHTQGYRRLLAELLRVIGGPGREAIARSDTAAAADVAVIG
jgi:hypothetical protein